MPCMRLCSMHPTAVNGTDHHFAFCCSLKSAYAMLASRLSLPRVPARTYLRDRLSPLSLAIPSGSPRHGLVTGGADLDYPDYQTPGFGLSGLSESRTLGLACGSPLP